MERIVFGMPVDEVLRTLRSADGYYITNTARDLSQSDYKNRILLHTDLLAAESREAAGYFSLEITGGASIHVDILRKQVDPFLKLELLRESVRLVLQFVVGQLTGELRQVLKSRALVSGLLGLQALPLGLDRVAVPGCQVEATREGKGRSGLGRNPKGKGKENKENGDQKLKEPVCHLSRKSLLSIGRETH